MEKAKLMGIVNREVGVVDFFGRAGDVNSVALPIELAVSDDVERINDWALRSGLIQQGQCIAVPSS